MEVHQEEIILGSKHMIFKGKRTKRQRTVPQPPFLLTMATTTSSSCSTGTPGGDSFTAFNRVTTSPSNSGELTQTSVVGVDQEEDMANCLILLAQGRARKSTQPTTHPPMPSTSTAKSSSAVHDVYQCKTCNRSFPSFQALGGHRASHKKPKPTDLEGKSPPPLSLGAHQESTVGLIRDEDTTLSLQIPSGRKDPIIAGDVNKSRVHECSICGAEFSSGQALGGHMRRHRPLPTLTGTSSNDEEGSREFAVKKPRALLSLDLNLPAAPDQPEDDYSTESKYPFASAKQQVIVFSASPHPLVDCHY
ncbi:zinc finger protein ZAT5-like [Coffea eugenioides]|uniref:zinc finger protein ZAT5-like n=1 Tax=Coffea eugenioides TaxID=49369 RepID=UPI000F607238|nr:zinc finger protein ZAT5-like [Coffea eugenioides]